MAEKVLRHDNQLADHLKASPRRPDGEKRLQEEFDRVKDPFLKEEKKADGSIKRGPGTRDKWYKGDLRKLAEDAGKEAEYDTFVTPFSGCVHSSAFAVGKGPMVSPEYVLFHAATLAARGAKMNVEYNQLAIGDDLLILDELCKGWFDRR